MTTTLEANFLANLMRSRYEDLLTVYRSTKQLNLAAKKSNLPTNVAKECLKRAINLKTQARIY